MKRNFLLLAVTAILSLSAAVKAYSIYAEIEINKEMFFTVEEGEQMKLLMPQYSDWFNSYIVAIKEGMTAAYKVDIWLDQDDVPIRSAYVEKPGGQTVPLFKDGPDSFDEDDEDGPGEFYVSLAHLEGHWPSGLYTLHVTFTDGHEQTWTTSIPDYNTTPFPDMPTGSLSTAPNGQITLNWNTVAGADEYEVWAFDVKKMRDAFDSGNLYYSHPNSYATEITSAYAGKGDYNIGVDAEMNVTSGNFGVEFTSQLNLFSFKKPMPPKQNQIDKCSVSAGKDMGMGNISFSGTLDAIEADFLLAMGDNVEVFIDSDLMPGDISFQFPIDDSTFKKGKYKYSESSKGSTYSFNYDANTGKMAFAVKNINLSGMACPITVTVAIGAYEAEILLDEAIVNGTKPCPQMFIQGFANNLTADKYSFKPGKLAGQDSFTVSGTFTIAGIPMPGQDFAVIIGSQTFTVDGSAFIQKKPNVYTCSNAQDKASSALVTAVLDFTKCTYTLTVKNAALSQFGTLQFSLYIFGFGAFSTDNIVHFNLKTRHVYDIYMDTEFDYGGTGPGDEEFGFTVEVSTDSAVTGIEFKTPGGKTYIIPDGYDDGPFEDGWYETGSDYDDDDDCYYWYWWIWFDQGNQLLDNYEDGLYEFTISFADGTSQKTTAWFGVPNTQNPIPQPTQEPAFTSFDDNDFLTSPVSFQWQPCQDPAASQIWLCLYDYDRDKETEWYFTKTSINGLKSPLRLKSGWYEAELDFETYYESKNKDGIPVIVGKYSECDYYFEVD